MAITKNIFSGLLDRIKFNRIVTKNSTLSEMPYGESQVQAVDIDWNDAQVHELDENGLPKLDANGNAYFKTITTTGNLLEYIQKGTVTGMNHILTKLTNAETGLGKLNDDVAELIDKGIDKNTIKATISEYLEENPSELVIPEDIQEAATLIENLRAQFGDTDDEINGLIAKLKSISDGFTGTDGEIVDIITFIQEKAGTNTIADQVTEALDAIKSAGNTLTEAQEALVIEAINSLLGRYDLNDDGTISSDEDGGAGLQGLLEQLLAKINQNTSDINDANDTITGNRIELLGEINNCVKVSNSDWTRLKNGNWATKSDLNAYTPTKDLPTLPPSMPQNWGTEFVGSSTFKDAVSDNAPKAPSTPKIHLTFNIPGSSTSLPFKTQFCTSGTTVTLKQNKIVAFDSSTTVGNTLNTVYFPLTNIISSLPELNCTLIGTKYSRSYSQSIEIPGTFKIYDENNEEITLVSSTTNGNKTIIDNITQYLNKSNTTYTIIFTPTDETNYTEAVVSIFVSAMTDYTSDSVKTNIANLVSAYKEVDDIQSNNNSSNGSSSTTPKPSKPLEYAFKFDEDNVIINTRNNSIKLRHFFDSNTAGVYHFVDNNQTEDDLTDDREFFTVTIRETAPDPAYDPSKTPTPSPTSTTTKQGSQSV